MNISEIDHELRTLADDNIDYIAFNRRIVNTKKTLYGVRIPALRKLAKRLAKNATAATISTYLDTHPNTFEHHLLAGIIINRAQLNDAEALALTCHYLKRVDSWAEIDSFVEKKPRLAPDTAWTLAHQILNSTKEQTVRFAIVLLMQHFLDDEHLSTVFTALRSVQHDGYYVRMAMAWLYAEAAVNHFHATLQELQNPQLNDWTRRKALQKMRESRRFSLDQQAEIRRHRNKGIA
ncbi:MAG: DNA alkylation repair protein [Cardiobacteriaceae bacterium]|nr:DNA alkylation repair protein [Cardiobacteriaceae bacterium]